MNLNGSYTAVWRLFRVDAGTWSETGQAGFESAHIVKSDSGTLESGQLTVSGDFEPGYYRLSMVSNGERVDVSTLYCRSSRRTENRGAVIHDVTGYSVLEPAERGKLFAGEFAPAGSDGAEFAANLLAGCVAAPVVIEGGFVLGNNIVFDGKTTVLEAAMQVLSAANYTIQIDETGTVHVRPMPMTVELDVGAGTASPGVDIRETEDVPNRYIAVDGAAIAIAVNDDPESATSVQALGFYSDEVDERPTLIDGETLQGYARRKLEELSVVKTEYNYTRDFEPGIYPGSLVRKGEVLRVSTMDITCGRGAIVNETSYREASTWRA